MRTRRNITARPSADRTGRRGACLGTTLFVAGCTLAFPGCDWVIPPASQPPSAVDSFDPETTFPISLHGTRRGKTTFYQAQAGGFEQITGIPIEDLWCQNCHARTRADGTIIEAGHYEPDCLDCHITEGGTVTEDACLKCHGRRRIERSAFEDVHVAAGMTCLDCHTRREMHGDGTGHLSMRAAGAMDVTCEGCHPDPPHSTSHWIHEGRLHCSACHTQAVLTCFNCHFDYNAATGHIGTTASAACTSNVLLLQEEETSLVHAGAMLGLSWNEQTFVLMTPYAGHTIAARGRSCNTCHGNAHVKQYLDDRTVRMTRWDETAGDLRAAEGAVPIPPDYRESLRFDFAKPVIAEDAQGRRRTEWYFLKDRADLMQMMYARPLTAEQWEHLSIAR